jgi:O-Antigen ligase
MIAIPVQTARLQGLGWLEAGLVAVMGFLFGAYPEAGLVAACVCTAWGLWRFPLFWSPSRDSLILLFALFRVVYAFRTQGSLWVALLEGLVMLVLPRAAWVLSHQHGRVFGLMAVLGLLLPIGIAGAQIWSLDLQTWQKDPTRALEKRAENFHRFAAVDAASAWVVQSLGVQGSGRVRYAFEVRARDSFGLKISLLHQSLPGGRAVAFCQPAVQWTKCEISADLGSSQQLDFVIGGFGLWKKGMPDLEIRRSEFRASAGPSVLDRLRLAPRQASLAFNENAFGAWVAMVFLLSLHALRDFRVTLVLALPMVLGIYLSGSRGVMLAGFFGWLILLLGQLQRLKMFAPVLVATFVCLVGVQIYLVTALPAQSTNSVSASFRAFNLNDTDSARSRLDIWQGAKTGLLLEPVFGPTVFAAGPLGTKLPVRAHTFDALPHAHNLWLQMMVEGGLIQVALVAALLGAAFFAILQRRDYGLLAPLIAILLINIADFLFYYAPLRFCFGMILGVGAITLNSARFHHALIQRR